MLGDRRENSCLRLLNIPDIVLHGINAAVQKNSVTRERPNVDPSPLVKVTSSANGSVPIRLAGLLASSVRSW